MVAPVQTDSNPFRAALEAALAAGTAVKITEVAGGRRYRYTHHHAAARVAGIVAEKRRGTVVVMANLARIRLANVTAVEEVVPAASISSGPYFVDAARTAVGR